jgi:hypothetical protein
MGEAVEPRAPDISGGVTGITRLTQPWSLPEVYTPLSPNKQKHYSLLGRDQFKQSVNSAPSIICLTLTPKFLPCALLSRLYRLVESRAVSKCLRKLTVPEQGRGQIQGVNLGWQ